MPGRGFNQRSKADRQKALFEGLADILCHCSDDENVLLCVPSGRGSAVRGSYKPDKLTERVMKLHRS